MIASGYTTNYLTAQIYGAFHAFHCPSSHTYKINLLHISTPGERKYAGVMQDKGIPNFVERICTTPFISPVMY
jgi:hypothetical protein